MTRELAWAHPQAPTFPFICPSCGERIELSFAWRLERGHDPRRLSVAGGSQPAPTSACVLLVDDCPHGCGTRLGLQLLPDDPALDVQLDQHHECVLGGYRCPDCDGEGRLWVDPSGLSNTPTPA